MKRFCGVFFGAFVLFVLGDSSSLRGQNQPAPQPVPEYICEPMKEYEQGMCLAVPILTSGGSDAQGPLANRIPVILIHGWQRNRDGVPAEPNVEIWRGLFRHFYESQWFREKFKVYFLFYWSNVQSVRDMGLTFMSLIGRMDELDRDFRGKQLVLVGHSMGGLIARSYMQEVRSGSRSLPGERVLRLITLGTPHHGTPIANGPARDHKAGVFARFLSLFDHGIFNRSLDWATHNRFDLHWDNYDGLLNYERYPEDNIWLKRLNSGETFERKIVAYGGVVVPSTQIDDCVLSFIPGGSPPGSGCLAGVMKRSLGVPESDGVVPLKSAFFEPCEGCFGTRVFWGYDHSEIAKGKSLFGETEKLFKSIAGDLRSAAISASRPALSVAPEDCIPYNPTNLRIVEQTNGWQLVEEVAGGRRLMATLDNQADAGDALALAKRHTAHCFIGRDNTRPNRLDYILRYWNGGSDIQTVIVQRDCIFHNPEKLEVVREGNDWFLIEVGDSFIHYMKTLASERDAHVSLNLARRYTSSCYIGRNNSRGPQRRSYILQYWE